MKKWMLIAAVILSGAIVLVTYKYQEPCVEKHHCCECQTQFGAVVAGIPPQTGNGADKTKQGTDCPPWWHVLIAWPEGITVWVILLTLFIIAWQSVETQQAARAALIQANHMVASERAWIIAHSAMERYRPNEVEKPIFYWAITNTGKTVARLIEAQCVYQLLLVEQLQALPVEPTYHLPTQFNRMPLPPSDSMSQSANLIHPPQSSALDQIGEDVKVIRMGLFVLLAYGYVRYLDVFGNERESRFIEKYIWPNEEVRNSGFQPYFDAPPAYSQHT